MNEKAHDLFNVRHTAVQRVDLPGTEAVVYVRSFTGADLDAWESELARRRKDDDSIDLAGLRALLVKLTACDESGALLFADAEVERVNDMPAKFLRAIADTAQKHNGLVSGIEDAEKN